MKKWIAMLLAALMVFSMAACAAKSEPAADQTNDQTAADTQTSEPAEDTASSEDAAPADDAAADSDLAYVQDGLRRECAVGSVPEDICAVDIGSRTAKQYETVILQARTVFVNGPMGIFEKPETELGTRTVFEALGEAPGYTVVGGGDSVTAAAKYQVRDKLGYVCTGGGALIRFLTGEELPVVRALRHAAQTF